jgi:hypothetical protein
MDPKDERKADAQLILEGKEAVVQRIVEVFNELFHKDKNATNNLKWLSSQLIHAEMVDPNTFKYGTLSLQEPLKQYISKVINEQVATTLTNAMALHAQQMDDKIKHLKNLEKKSWRTR